MRIAAGSLVLIMGAACETSRPSTPGSPSRGGSGRDATTLTGDGANGDRDATVAIDFGPGHDAGFPVDTGRTNPVDAGFTDNGFVFPDAQTPDFGFETPDAGFEPRDAFVLPDFGQRDFGPRDAFMLPDFGFRDAAPRDTGVIGPDTGLPPDDAGFNFQTNVTIDDSLTQFVIDVSPGAPADPVSFSAVLSYSNGGPGDELISVTGASFGAAGLFTFTFTVAPPDHLAPVGVSTQTVVKVPGSGSGFGLIGAALLCMFPLPFPINLTLSNGQVATTIVPAMCIQ